MRLSFLFHQCFLGVVILWSTLFLSACEPTYNQEVDVLNQASYSFHYRNLDSTKVLAERALNLAKLYDDGWSEAMNNLAFVKIARMDYDGANNLLDEIIYRSENQLELYVANVQKMRLCQRQSRNKDFYIFRQQAMRCQKRIREELKSLSNRQKQRLTYANSEFAIVESTYFYYIGLPKKSMKALEQIDPSGEIIKDTAQLLAYYYNLGSGGIITTGSQRDISQREFDYLIQCLTGAIKHGYIYWEANSLQAFSEHMRRTAMRDTLIRENLPAMKFINKDNMPDSLLAGNLAERAVDLFSKYGDVYQTAGAYRTLAESYWELHDYRSALVCLNEALEQDTIINRAPDLVASIREQLSLAYSAIDDKSQSDYNRNIYLDMQEITRQDRQLDARAAQLDLSSEQLNLMITGVVLMILIVVGLLVQFSRMRRKKDAEESLDDLLSPLRRWNVGEAHKMNRLSEQNEEIDEQIKVSRLHVLNNKKRNIEQRAKVALINSITPFIDRILNEINRLQHSTEEPTIRKQRFDYIAELTEQINQYNDILTHWIQLRQGELNLRIESFPLADLFNLVSKGQVSFSLHGVQLQVINTSLVVKADKTLTLFMINTIADNARKFTPKGGTVIISAEDTEAYVEVSVTDNGCGMDEEQLSHVFNHKPLNGDHGFGLMNCKGIIEKYKKISSVFSVCTIGAVSKKGEGSRFFFRLPKGVARSLLLLLMATLPLGHSWAKSEREHVVFGKSFQHRRELYNASRYADSVYFANINGDYNSALVFADSTMKYLNAIPRHLRNHDYNLVLLDMKNEAAVAALALHKWDVYRANNKIYTQLFRKMSADNTLDNYVRVMQRSKNSKNVAIILLVLLLLSILPAYFFLYYRHVVFYRYCVELINKINDKLLSDFSAQEKLNQLNVIWSSRKRYLSGRENRLTAIVNQIRAALKKSIQNDQLWQANIDLVRDELRRTQFDEARLYISNSVLDNCLSTLKHETMYYPSRISRLMEEGCEDNLVAIGEVANYYKQLYSILSQQAMVQLNYELRIDEDILKYLLDMLKKLSKCQAATIEVHERDDHYVVIKDKLTGVSFTEEQCSNLFTPTSVNIEFMICRQIVREIGEMTNMRRSGIQALRQSNDEIMVEITLPKKIMNKMQGHEQV